MVDVAVLGDDSWMQLMVDGEILAESFGSPLEAEEIVIALLEKLGVDFDLHGGAVREGL